MGNITNLCKSLTYSTMVENAYSHYDKVLDKSKRQYFIEFLKEEKMLQSHCILSLKYPIIIYKKYEEGTHSTNGIILYSYDSKEGQPRLFYGEVQNNKPAQSGLVVYWDKTCFCGTLQVTKLNNKYAIKKKKGKLYDEYANLIGDGKWQEEIFIEGQLMSEGGYSIMVKNRDYIINYSDGSKYVGSGKITQNREFIREGKGEFKTADKKYSYNGDWIDNKKHGKGLAKYKTENGEETYDGQFKINMKYGQGTYTTKKYILKGQWKGDDKFKGFIFREGQQNISKEARQINWD